MSVAYRFFIAGILFALTGMSLGIYMGTAQDFTLAPVHAHINLVGWASHFLYGLYYRVEPSNAKGALPEIHFFASLIGGISLALGVVGAVTNNRTLDLAVIPGSILTVAGMILFLVVVIRGWMRQRNAGERIALPGTVLRLPS